MRWLPAFGSLCSRPVIAHGRSATSSEARTGSSPLATIRACRLTPPVRAPPRRGGGRSPEGPVILPPTKPRLAPRQIASWPPSRRMTATCLGAAPTRITKRTKFSRLKRTLTATLSRPTSAKRQPRPHGHSSYGASCRFGGLVRPSSITRQDVVALLDTLNAFKDARRKAKDSPGSLLRLHDGPQSLVTINPARWRCYRRFGQPRHGH